MGSPWSPWRGVSSLLQQANGFTNPLVPAVFLRAIASGQTIKIIAKYIPKGKVLYYVCNEFLLLAQVYNGKKLNGVVSRKKYFKYIRSDCDYLPILSTNRRTLCQLGRLESITLCNRQLSSANLLWIDSRLNSMTLYIIHNFTVDNWQLDKLTVNSWQVEKIYLSSHPSSFQKIHLTIDTIAHIKNTMATTTKQTTASFSNILIA